MSFLGIASNYHQTVPSSKSVLAAVASFTASAILIRTIANELIPNEIRNSIFSHLRDLSNHLLSSQLIIVIEEFDGLSINQIFEAAYTYLGTKIARSTRRLKLSQPEKEKNFTVSMDRNEEIVDLFEGVQLKWVFVCTQVQPSPIFNNNNRDLISNLRSEIRTFELSFHKKYKEKVLGSYVPYILRQSKAIKEERKVGKLHTIDYNSVGFWGVVNLDHPATFDTLAMDPELKKMVTDDLERFVKRKDFYKSVGKAWKRGYLLYGPPGTGKSSLVAAMANYLNFNIYDLDLTDIRSNSDLRRILIGTANRSIIVIEDIDCNIDLQDRAENAPSAPRDHYDSQVTLSGVLNFIDGLWSSCGDERIIVFTTNHKERLDPALLRPGRMDMHIHMSYCTPSGFKILAHKYLKISDHWLFEEIEGLIETREVTPAEVAGELMKNEDVEISLQELIKFLKTKKMDLDAGKDPKKDTVTEGQEGQQQHQNQMVVLRNPRRRYKRRGGLTRVYL